MVAAFLTATVSLITGAAYTGSATSAIHRRITASSILLLPELNKFNGRFSAHWQVVIQLPQLNSLLLDFIDSAADSLALAIAVFSLE